MWSRIQSVRLIYNIIIHRYKFYYHDENDITYLCMGENLDMEVAFSYLADLKKNFMSSYDLKKD